jgi:hypothetical protein
VTGDELLSALTALRRAQIGNRRAPHKPLLMLWLLGRFAASGSTAVTYDETEEPVSRLINDFGPAVVSPSRARERAAMPFVHLERDLWDLRDRDGDPIGPDAPERGGFLRARGAHGHLHPHIEHLLAGPGTLAAAARLLVDQHFTPALEATICAVVGLDVTRSPAGRAVDALHGQPITAPRPGRPGVDPVHIVWHGLQVFKRPAAQAAERRCGPGRTTAADCTGDRWPGPPVIHRHPVAYRKRSKKGGRHRRAPGDSAARACLR